MSINDNDYVSKVYPRLLRNISYSKAKAGEYLGFEYHYSCENGPGPLRPRDVVLLDTIHVLDQIDVRDASKFSLGKTKIRPS